MKYIYLMQERLLQKNGKLLLDIRLGKRRYGEGRVFKTQIKIDTGIL